MAVKRCLLCSRLGGNITNVRTNPVVAQRLQTQLSDRNELFPATGELNICSGCLPSLMTTPTAPRRSPRGGQSNVMDATVTSSESVQGSEEVMQRPSQEVNVSSQDVNLSSQDPQSRPSIGNNSGILGAPQSQQVMSQESRNPQTQRVLQDIRNKPGPKSVKRLRGIEVTQDLNWRDRFNKRIRGDSSSRDNSRSSESESLQERQVPAQQPASPPSAISPQPDRSYVIRPASQIQSSTNMPPPAPAARTTTDDANGHSNLAAPRRIFTSTTPPPPQANYNPRNSGKLPGG